MLGTKSGVNSKRTALAGCASWVCSLSVLADWIVDRIRLERRSSVAGVFYQSDARGYTSE